MLLFVAISVTSMFLGGLLNCSFNYVLLHGRVYGLIYAFDQDRQSTNRQQFLWNWTFTATIGIGRNPLPLSILKGKHAILVLLFLFLSQRFLGTNPPGAKNQCDWSFQIHEKILVDDKEMAKLFVDKGKECSLAMNSAVVGSLVQFQKNIQNSLEGRLRQLVNSKHKIDDRRENESVSGLMKASFEKQLEAWKVNPFWVDQPPEIKSLLLKVNTERVLKDAKPSVNTAQYVSLGTDFKSWPFHILVSVPKGSLCNLNAKFNVGLPPDAIFNIVTDPDNKRVFKNIKEVSSRKVLLDEGSRQVVEVEQAAIWRFLLWSGTITVNLIVDQNRKYYTVKFKQGKSGFMKRFEGCWKIEPLFVDEQMCRPYRPRMWSDYDSCTQGKRRVGSVVSLDQLIQPALMPPPPISWYLRGITIRTTEMLVKDLFVEAARLRCAMSSEGIEGNLEGSVHHSMLDSGDGFVDLKQRWHVRRKENRRRNRRLLLAH